MHMPGAQRLTQTPRYRPGKAAWEITLPELPQAKPTQLFSVGAQISLAPMSFPIPLCLKNVHEAIKMTTHIGIPYPYFTGPF